MDIDTASKKIQLSGTYGKFNPDAIVKDLLNLRRMVVHRMKSPDIAPTVYNECRLHVLAIDEQITKRNEPVTLDPMPARTFTRAQRMTHKRKAGNTFTERMLAKVGRK